MSRAVLKRKPPMMREEGIQEHQPLVTNREQSFGAIAGIS